VKPPHVVHSFIIQCINILLGANNINGKKTDVHSSETPVNVTRLHGPASTYIVLVTWFICSPIKSSTAVRTIRSTSQWILKANSSGLKQPQHETSLPSSVSVELKNEVNYISTNIYAFVQSGFGTAINLLCQQNSWHHVILRWRICLNPDTKFCISDHSLLMKLSIECMPIVAKS
jgi:hypothetical protein